MSLDCARVFNREALRASNLKQQNVNLHVAGSVHDHVKHTGLDLEGIF